MKTHCLVSSLKLTIVFILLIQSGMASAQVYGCKDPAATNYNAAATVNNGSCLYSATAYAPPVKVDPLSNTLTENSGLQMAGGFLWSFNDGGNTPVVYRVDTISGAVLQTITLEGAVNHDWEDLAFDGTSFYIGDFGNNGDGIRTDLKIYKFPVSAIASYTTKPLDTVRSSQIDIINFAYGNQTDFTNATTTPKFDCEAMIVDGGKIHLFTKNWVDVNSTHYVINGITGGSYVADSLETIATNYLVTGADINPAGTTIVLLGYQVTGFYNHFMHILSDYSGGLFFNGNKRRIDLPNVFTMGQAEGICFRTATYGYISNERISSPFTVTQKLRSFDIGNLTPAYTLPLGLIDFSVVNTTGRHTINWKFAAPVNHLQVLFSDNGRTFNSITTIDQTERGSFTYRPTSVQNCYKISWQQNDGRTAYSNGICLNNIAKEDLYNIGLHANGQLQFMSRSTDRGLFRIISTDGRLLATSTSVTLVAGSNTIRFNKQLVRGALVLLQVVGKKEQRSLLIKVSD